nr:MAG TPA: hypothetical protein [Caudoviricetes sp.]
MRVFQRADEQIKSNGIHDKKTATSESPSLCFQKTAQP